MKKILSLILLGSIILSFYSCSDEPSDIGVNLISKDIISVKTFDTKDTTVIQNSSYLKKVIPLGSSNRILIGKREGLTASTLMKFVFVLADSLKPDFLSGDVKLTKAFIKLTPTYTFTDTLAGLDFTVHKINTRWSSTNFTIDDLPGVSFDAEDLSSNKNVTDSLYTFDLDTSLVASWLRNSIDTTVASNFGIYFKPTDASGKIVGFQALTPFSFNAAKIDFILEKQGSFIDTVKGFIFSDVSVVEGDLPQLPAGEIGVQAALTVQSKIFFDLSFIPRGAVVNNAQLILSADTLSSITGSSFSSNLNAFLLADSSNIDSVFGTETSLLKVGDVYSGDVTAIINSWVSGRANFGFVIKPVNLVDGLELFALRGSSFADSTLRPRLKIVFTEREQ